MKASGNLYRALIATTASQNENNSHRFVSMGRFVLVRRSGVSFGPFAYLLGRPENTTHTHTHARLAMFAGTTHFGFMSLNYGTAINKPNIIYKNRNDRWNRWHFSNSQPSHSGRMTTTTLTSESDIIKYIQSMEIVNKQICFPGLAT